MKAKRTNEGLTREELRDLATMLPSGRVGFRAVTVGGQYIVQWPDGLVTVDGKFSRIDGAPLTAEETVFVRELYALLKLNRAGKRAA